MHEFGKMIIICGHYGCGKTNFSINLAKKLHDEGRKVTLMDLDIVNPYFRSSDYQDLIEDMGIQVIAPQFARSNADVPSLPAAMYSIFSMPQRTVIIDAGGDDAGATALGRLSKQMKEQNYEMYYLVNKYRALSTEEDQAVQLAYEIENASRLKITSIINNSHLQGYTDEKIILDSLEYADNISKRLALPLTCTTVPRRIKENLQDDIVNIFPVDIYVKTPWA